MNRANKIATKLNVGDYWYKWDVDDGDFGGQMLPSEVLIHEVREALAYLGMRLVSDDKGMRVESIVDYLDE